MQAIKLTVQSKNRTLSIAILVLIILWLASVPILLAEHISILSLVVVVLPVILAAYIIWQQRNLIPTKKFQHLVDLAESIKSQVSDDRTPVDSESLPKEFKPLGEAINALLEYDADRIQQEKMFSADASHELRTPLTGIRLQTQLALQASSENERVEALESIKEAIDNATGLVEQLLVITRLTANQVELAMEPIRIKDLCEKIVINFRQRAEKESIRLDFSTSGNDSRIQASEECISILMHNLLTNAFKFSPESSLVTVTLESNSDNVKLSVADSGPGIPLAQRERVLRRFQKAENNSKAGSGLGLAITKRIVELHSATINLGDNIPSGLLVEIIFPRYSSF